MNEQALKEANVLLTQAMRATAMKVDLCEIKHGDALPFLLGYLVAQFGGDKITEAATFGLLDAIHVEKCVATEYRDYKPAKKV